MRRGFRAIPDPVPELKKHHLGKLSPRTGQERGQRPPHGDIVFPLQPLNAFSRRSLRHLERSMPLERTFGGAIVAKVNDAAAPLKLGYQRSNLCAEHLIVVSRHPFCERLKALPHFGQRR